MLQTFDIAGPVTATIDEKVATTTAAVGSCTTDTFSLASDGNQGTPIICGYNTGQHGKAKLLSSFSSHLQLFFFILVLVGRPSCLETMSKHLEHKS